MSEQHSTATDSLSQSLGRVGVLFGGVSAEREISLQSGAAVMQALSDLGIEHVGIDIGATAIADIQAAQLDRAFVALHGPGGEDGRIQAVLEYLHIPYTGSDVQSSALAMDKLRSKQLWSGVGLPTPEFSVLDSQSDFSAVLQSLGGEAFVKPAHEGSSLGMARVGSVEELTQAYEAAAKFDGSVLVERLVTGAEYTVAILGDSALPPIKLETDHRFYDFDAKYLADDTRYICPCGLDEKKEQQLKDLALQAFSSLGCRGWGRVDVMADQAGDFYLLEVNTIPGMTSHSLVPMAARAEGLSFSALILRILQESLRRS
ncbi:D-alanine--D-alanine ligase [Marinimicrobium sp. ABcell2]|uniref:D-alanine--D-alanine ligase n=1 Tax=Marinimicrobium sp. ABcell2 TaxID=3069751 RepID=UPI0027B1917A|nr:D-alanine--D-alanine ligase [Marinimicrobium sp. ABcell2]MDQ2075089.1 D-alanine--D-alanine ligase [Marinimicrobium sp. ABcell2]